MLQIQARHSQCNTLAKGTYQNLSCQWVKFLIFCLHFDLVALPASTTVLVWLAQWLGNKMKSHATVVAYLS